jgi:hypothetical protein
MASFNVSRWAIPSWATVVLAVLTEVIGHVQSADEGLTPSEYSERLLSAKEISLVW